MITSHKYQKTFRNPDRHSDSSPVALNQRWPGTTPRHRQHSTKEPAGVPTGGTPIAEFRVLVNRRVKDGDQWVNGEPTGHNVKVVGTLAEHAVDQLAKGRLVIVHGRVETDVWPDRDTGEKRTTTRVIVDRHGTLGLALTANSTRQNGDGADDYDATETDPYDE